MIYEYANKICKCEYLVLNFLLLQQNYVMERLTTLCIYIDFVLLTYLLLSGFLEPA